MDADANYPDYQSSKRMILAYFKITVEYYSNVD